MKPPITFVQDDEEFNNPYSTFNVWLGRLGNLLTAIGMVTVAGAVGYFFGG